MFVRVLDIVQVPVDKLLFVLTQVTHYFSSTLASQSLQFFSIGDSSSPLRYWPLRRCRWLRAVVDQRNGKNASK